MIYSFPSRYTVTMRAIRSRRFNRRVYYAVILDQFGRTMVEGLLRRSRIRAEQDMVVFFRNLPSQ